MNYPEIVKKLETKEADLWREVYPRAYGDADRFGSPKVAAALAATSITWIREGYDRAPATARNIYLGTCVARRFAFPALFLAPDLFAAVAETEPPADLRWQDLLLPYEAGTLCLPTGAFAHPTDGPCGVLCWARARAGESLQWPGAQRVALQEDAFFVYTGLTSGTGFPLLDTVLNAKTSPLVGDSHSPGTHTQPGRDGIYNVPLAPSESAFLQQCRALVFSALLAIEARPALVTEGKRVAAGKRSHREIWTPNVIGREYRIAREGSGAGTHASPRLHWRRGHFREQRFGPGRAETRRIWIDPMLVGMAGEK